MSSMLNATLNNQLNDQKQSPTPLYLVRTGNNCPAMPSCVTNKNCTYFPLFTVAPFSYCKKFVKFSASLSCGKFQIHILWKRFKRKDSCPQAYTSGNSQQYFCEAQFPRNVYHRSFSQTEQFFLASTLVYYDSGQFLRYFKK